MSRDCHGVDLPPILHTFVIACFALLRHSKASFLRKLSRKSRRLSLAILLVVALIDAAGPLLVAEDELHSADAIVVIGGDHKPERMQRAAELYQHGYAPLIIISAGTTVLEGDQYLPEAEVMRWQIHALGVPDVVLMLEQASQSTQENAIDTREICRARGIHSILLVTSAYQSSRARLIFRSLFEPDIDVSVQPASQGVCPLCWPLMPDRANVVWYEYRNWIQLWLSELYGTSF
jgi:uncharacterized SAM-binding protein YcdF (DUF218 family)